ncbi:hypothetical protein JNUCC1_03351 [Lentibacillus sp. JNUCC-1]|uniref:head-tail connector protein n=1 Tax=Lentibacillus sp. JNUCC-1 TaxID=2654513 RepID=UPI0012E7A3BC|nr:head-tail connector protein [Lentibacillus sp. JNUCC-1]MUV39473.1 hypothetical protein [Lentibacillus sp. JNUCC-1]
MNLKVITEPTESAVNIELVKEFLRIDYNDEDMLIQTMIDAAIDHAEKFTRRSLNAKTYELNVKASDYIRLPNPRLPAWTR